MACCRANACLRQPAAAAGSPRRSAIGANCSSAEYRNQPSQTLSPRPATPTRFMPSFQSPVPNSGRPCEPMARLESRPRTQCSNSEAAPGGFRGGQGFLAVRRQRTACEERHLLVQHREILGDLQVVGDHEGEPDAVIRNPRFHALARGRQPPMLNIARLELARRGAQDMLARDRRLGDAQAP